MCTHTVPATVSYHQLMILQLRSCTNDFDTKEMTSYFPLLFRPWSSVLSDVRQPVNGARAGVIFSLALQQEILVFIVLFLHHRRHFLRSVDTAKKRNSLVNGPGRPKVRADWSVVRKIIVVKSCFRCHFAFMGPRGRSKGELTRQAQSKWQGLVKGLIFVPAN